MTRFDGVAWRDYKGTKRFEGNKGYNGFRWATRGYNGLQGVKRSHGEQSPRLIGEHFGGGREQGLSDTRGGRGLRTRVLQQQFEHL